MFDAMGTSDEELKDEVKCLVADVLYCHDWMSWVLDGGVTD